MLEKQTAALALILKDHDIQNYAGDAFFNLISTVISQDPISGVKTAQDIKNIIFHMPTVIFWDKMKRYLYATYTCFSDQVRMAEKFNNDHRKYTDYVKRQIHLINEINDDLKVDYFASLTRCFLLTDLEEDLYFKLAKFLSMCTPSELEYIQAIPYDCKYENSMMISSLYQYGLFTSLSEDDGGTKYVLSDFGKSLKQNSLNFEDGVGGQERLTSYSMLIPLSLPESIPNEDIIKILENQELILDGGNATEPSWEFI